MRRPPCPYAGAAARLRPAPLPPGLGGLQGHLSQPRDAQAEARPGWLGTGARARADDGSGSAQARGGTRARRGLGLRKFGEEGLAAVGAARCLGTSSGREAAARGWRASPGCARLGLHRAWLDVAAFGPLPSFLPRAPPRISAMSSTSPNLQVSLPSLPL